MVSDTPFAYLISKPPLIQINLYLSKAKAKVSAVPFCCAIISPLRFSGQSRFRDETPHSLCLK